MINLVAELIQNIKRCEITENKGFGFTSQQVMDAVLEYAKVTVTIQYYAKAKSYAKATGTLSEPKYNRRAWRRAAATSN